MNTIKLLTGFALAFILTTGLLHAQKVTLGIEGGKTLDGNQSNDASAFLNSGGWTVGGFAELSLFNPFTFRAEAHYSFAKRTIEVTRSNGTTQSRDYSFNYLQLPVNIKLELGGSTIRPYIYAGTTMGALLSATPVPNGTGTDGMSDEEEQFAPIDVTADIGGGVSIGLSDQISIGADIRYTYGLVDLISNSPESWRSRNVKLLTGIYFTL